MNNKVQKLVALFCLTLISRLALGQAAITWEKTVHNFQDIKEGTLSEVEFKFTNTSKEPLLITNVVASCGCTTPEWPKEPVMPGKSSKIKAVYNSTGRPGSFMKVISVHSNAKPQQSNLTIKGVVIPSPETKGLSEEEFNMLPKAFFESNQADLGDVAIGSQKKTSFKVKNLGQTPLTINNVISVCNCTSFFLDRTAIQPNDEATIEVIYYPMEEGAQKELLIVETNDLRTPTNKLYLTAKVFKNANEAGPKGSKLQRQQRVLK